MDALPARAATGAGGDRGDRHPSLAAGYARIAAPSSALRPSATFRHEAEGAADYLKRSGIRGNIFNEYSLGGYLAWRLHPELKVFIYGRMAYPELLALYEDVLKNPTQTTTLGAGGGIVYFYQKVFDEHAVNAAVLPAGRQPERRRRRAVRDARAR